MRRRGVVVAAILTIAPLGAKAADLVVWWEQGYNPEEDAAVREIVAAVEQDTGKQAAASGDWRHQLVDQERNWAKAIQRVVPEGISPEQAVDGAIARIKQILSQ